MRSSTRVPRLARTGLVIFALGHALSAPPALADAQAFVDRAGQAPHSGPATDPRHKLALAAPQDFRLRKTDAHRLAMPRSDYRLRPPWARDPEADRLIARRPYRSQVSAAADAHDVDPALIHAVIAAESNYDPKARSHKGAVGLMQVMPGTARRYGVAAKELGTPERNIATGTRYLAELIALFEGNLELALAAYNAGETTVMRYGRKIPPFAETLAYVPRVLRMYDALRVR